jgi:hypothetical protein
VKTYQLTANENDGKAMFNVYLYDPVSNSSQMEKFVSIGSLKNIKSATLAEIRKSLISENALSWRQYVMSDNLTLHLCILTIH